MFRLLFASAVLLLTLTAAAQNTTVESPDGRLSATVVVDGGLRLQIRDAGVEVLTAGPVALRVRGSDVFAGSPTVTGTERTSRDTVLSPQVRERSAAIRERYNEARIMFGPLSAMRVRVFDNGVAYRFETSLPGEAVIDGERCDLSFPAGTSVIAQLNTSYWSTYENPYSRFAADRFPADSMANLPLLAATPSGYRIVVTEADVRAYPGLWFRRGDRGEISACSPGYPLEFLDEGHVYTRGKVTRHAPEIARTAGTRSFPWRVFAVGRTDAELLENSMVYLLGEPSRLPDARWVRPGQVTLDWWGRRNLFGVDFKGGVNMPTIRYFIDFAARYGIDYVLLDDGWSAGDDLLRTTAGLDMEEIVRYARSRNVRILLWAVWSTLERQWDAAFDQFARWGIAGIKVDFMNRDDQRMVEFYHRCAEETARREMLIIFHGAYKPDGLRRTWPNVIVREGLIEFEQNGVNRDDSPDYHTLLPFIRMVAGPADYIPGTVRNAQRHEFAMFPDRPMGQGTRAHTMALCVIIESPLRMLPDSPSDHIREDACTSFMTGIPVEWDEQRVLHATLGEHVAIARRNGGTWFAGAVTNWNEASLTIDLSFLEPGVPYRMTVVEDGANANTRATDHRIRTATVRSGDRIPVHMAKGGGWVARFERL